MIGGTHRQRLRAHSIALARLAMAGRAVLPVDPFALFDVGAVMASRTDTFLHDVVAKGGSAMGLSSFMPAWQGIFKDKEIQDLVGYIRTLALPRK